MSGAPPVALLGAGGKMGRMVERCLDEAADLHLAARIDRGLAPDPGPPRTIGRAAELRPGEVVAILDVSSPSGTREAAEAAVRLGCALVSGTTGLDPATQTLLREAAGRVPVCWSPNFSIGIPLLARMVREAAAHLPRAWQAEILEIHHSGKKDAPSGTALRLAEAWTAARPGPLVHGRSGAMGPRSNEEVGIHAARLADVVGEHRVLLGGAGEMIEITHRAAGREAFARGCVEALRRITTQGPGWYEWDELIFGG